MAKDSGQIDNRLKNDMPVQLLFFKCRNASHHFDVPQTNTGTRLLFGKFLVVQREFDQRRYMISAFRPLII